MKCHLLLLVMIFFTISASSQNPVKLSNDQFNFTEGPVWDGEEFIYFTEIRKSKVWKYSVKTGMFSEAFADTNKANGLAFNENHDLLLCEGNMGRITSRDTEGNILDIKTASYQGKRFNTTNDMCIDVKGGVYFTDPSWGKPFQPDNAIYYLNTKGEVTKLDSFGEGKPNGIVLSPDGNALYVNDSNSTTVFRYNVSKKDGKVSNRIHFATITKEGTQKKTGADGMAVDMEGNLYITANKTLQIFDKNGDPLKTIQFPEKTTNCTFGGVNKMSLFVTGTTNLYRVDLNVKGVTHPFDLPK